MNKLIFLLFSHVIRIAIYCPDDVDNKNVELTWMIYRDHSPTVILLCYKQHFQRRNQRGLEGFSRIPVWLKISFSENFEFDKFLIPYYSDK